MPTKKRYDRDKLAEAIRTALPEINYDKSYELLNIILNAIPKVAKKDGFLTIQGFGKFQIKYYKPCRRLTWIMVDGFRVQEEMDLPGRYYLAFTPCRSLRSAGNNGD